MKYLIFFLSMILVSCGGSDKQEESAKPKPKPKVKYTPIQKVNIILDEIENFDPTLYTSSEYAIDNTISRFSSWNTQYKLNKKRIKVDSVLEKNELIPIEAEKAQKRSMPILREAYARILDKKLTDVKVKQNGQTITFTNPRFLSQLAVETEHKKYFEMLVILEFKKVEYRPDERRSGFKYEY